MAHNVRQEGQIRPAMSRYPAPQRVKIFLNWKMLYLYSANLSAFIVNTVDHFTNVCLLFNFTPFSVLKPVL